jgi:prepilin-type N-terminal cleavage/methylation domain-containing protein
VEKQKKAFTLVEILVVVIIIGILSTLGFVNYSRIKEGALTKEARANLKLIAAAERIYRMEYGHYYIQGTGETVTDINRNLRLGLNETNWGYQISNTGGTNNTFQAVANRPIGANTCTYSIDQGTAGEPTGNANCP